MPDGRAPEAGAATSPVTRLDLSYRIRRFVKPLHLRHVFRDFSLNPTASGCPVMPHDTSRAVPSPGLLAPPLCSRFVDLKVDRERPGG